MFGTLIAYALLHYSERLKHFVLRYPIITLLFGLCGAVFSSCFFIEPLVNVFGCVVVNFSFSLLYKAAVAFVEVNIECKYRLIALSLLFMFGDIGAILGANTWPFIVQSVCDKNTQSYYCDDG